MLLYEGKIEEAVQTSENLEDELVRAREELEEVTGRLEEDIDEVGCGIFGLLDGVIKMCENEFLNPFPLYILYCFYSSRNRLCFGFNNVFIL